MTVADDAFADAFPGDDDASQDAYRLGWRHGAEGDRIDQAARLDPVTGHRYGAGLANGRRARIDRELAARAHRDCPCKHAGGWGGCMTCGCTCEPDRPATCPCCGEYDE